MIKIIICGAKGRMGARIATLISCTDDMQIAAEVDINDSLESVIDKADVVVDFSTPEASIEHAAIAAAHDKPIIIGTTGLDDHQEEFIRKTSSAVPIVHAPNMSIGVNVMFKLIEMASSILGAPYAIDIAEIHHSGKVDRPSGTAIKMAEIAIGSRGVSTDITNYEEALVKRKDGDDSIRLCSIREGDVIGEHEIRFRGNEEIITIKHHATSRGLFAKGALTAARWIIGKPAGLYDMTDVLNLRR